MATTERVYSSLLFRMKRGVVGRAVRAVRRAKGVVVYGFFWCIGQARRMRNHVRASWPGSGPVAAREDQAIYVHYDVKGIVHDYAIEQLKSLADAGFQVTLVSNSPRFPLKSVEEVAPYCNRILWRRNVGYDFGAYKDGIASLGDLNDIRRLILMNDSVYGPFQPLAKTLSMVDLSATDVWGITDSWELRYHIQSYFILFSARCLQLREFRNFWRNMGYVNHKPWVIRYGEQVLTQRLTQQKMRASVLCSYWDVARAVMHRLEERGQGTLTFEDESLLQQLKDAIVRGVPVNPSYFFWEVLLTDFLCPFIKREVITSNPARLPLTWRWADVIAGDGSYDPDLIVRHLKTL